MKNSFDFRFFVKTAIGASSEILFPAAAKDLSNGVTNGKHVFVKRMIFYSRMNRAIKSSNPDDIDRVSRQWWTGDVAGYFYGKYTARTNRFENLFLRHFSWCVDEVQTLQRTTGIRTLVEFGCGDGSVLRHLAKTVAGLDRLVGVDINAIVIDKNTQRNDEKCIYRHVRIQDFFETGPVEPFIAFSFGGVLEYLSPKDLTAFYANLAQRGCSLVIIEPLSSDLKAGIEGGSAFIGSEVVYFDHDHGTYLSKVGFRVIAQKTVNLMSYRWLYAAATPRQTKTETSPPGAGDFA